MQEYPLDIKRILDKGEIVIGIANTDDPPFYMTDKNGELVGLDIEIAKGIAKELGVKLSFNRDSPTVNGVLDLVFNRKVDAAISMISVLLKRATKVDFTKPYFIGTMGFLVDRMVASKAKNDKELFSLINSPDKKVAILSGSDAFAETLHKFFPKAQKVVYKEWSELFNALASKKVVAVVVDEVIVKTFGITHPELVLNIETINVLDEKDYIAIALPWNSYNFLSWLNIYITRNWSHLKLDDYLHKYSKYFEPTVKNGDRRAH